MNQQINLYLPEFKTRKDLLTVMAMAQLIAVMLVVMVVVSSYELFTRWRLEAELLDLRQVLAAETSKTDELSKLLERRSQNRELSRRLDRAEDRLESSRQIRNFLSETKLGNVSGFSEQFKDLSRATLNGLSITEFSFSQGGEETRVAGWVVESAMVPRFVTNLQDSNSAIKDQLFNSEISREERYLSFVLSTQNE